jgi:hypothetical protein
MIGRAGADHERLAAPDLSLAENTRAHARKVENVTESRRHTLSGLRYRAHDPPAAWQCLDLRYLVLFMIDSIAFTAAGEV